MSAVRVLFESYLIYHLPQFLPLLELIRTDPRFDVRLTVSGHTPEEIAQSQSLLRAEGHTLIAGDTDEARYRAIDEFGPDVVVCGWGRRGYHEHVNDTAKPVFVMVYHGIGVKASYYHDNHARIGFRAVESPYRAQQLAQHNVHARPILTGCIKLDPLFGPAPSTPAPAIAGLNLDPSKPTVLYAPTYYPSSIGILRETVAEVTRDYNLVIKPHNYTVYHPDYQRDHAMIRFLADRYPHVRLVPPEWYNVIPLMRCSDLLLTDASSVMFEYLPLNRPVVVCTKHQLFLRHRLFRWFYVRNRIDTQTLAHDSFYDTVRAPRTLGRTLEQALAHPESRAAQRQSTMKTMLHFDDGRSAGRLRDALLGMFQPQAT